MKSPLEGLAFNEDALRLSQEMSALSYLARHYSNSEHLVKVSCTSAISFDIEVTVTDENGSELFNCSKDGIYGKDGHLQVTQLACELRDFFENQPKQ